MSRAVDFDRRARQSAVLIAELAAFYRFAAAPRGLLWVQQIIFEDFAYRMDAALDILSSVRVAGKDEQS